MPNSNGNEERTGKVLNVAKTLTNTSDNMVDPQTNTTRRQRPDQKPGGRPDDMVDPQTDKTRGGSPKLPPLLS